MIRDWKAAIAIAWHVQNETAKLDKGKVWDYCLPKVAATEQELAKTEDVLGFALDPRYREFLSFANGWPHVLQDVDLFGTADLQGGRAMQEVLLALNDLDSEALTQSKLCRSELLPIGSSSEQSDMFLMLKPTCVDAGTIIWFAGYEIERFPQFDDFFLAMVDYNRLRLERLRAGE